MAARFYVLVAQELLDDRTPWEDAGLHLLEQGILTGPGMRICRLLDDNAPEDLEGKTVELSVTRGYRNEGDLAESTWVSERRVTT